MELKLCIYRVNRLTYTEILIEPVGIETPYLHYPMHFDYILIEPVGIETIVTFKIKKQLTILIEPVGIETSIYHKEHE